jgi:hypothetical protein
MNKLVNLIILFVSLQYLIPLLKLDNVVENSHLNNLTIALIIGLIQFIYNYGMKFSNRKETTLKENTLDSGFKAFVVLGGIYLFEDIKDANIELFPQLQSSQFFRSSFITLLITFFILIKCLITP